MTKKSKCTCDQHLDYKGCCEDIYRALNDCKYGLKYNKSMRSHKWLNPHGGTMGHSIDYCPWCGTKLLAYLGDRRIEILENEYGISDEYDKKQSKKVPAEFLTDEWWKKRGL